MDRQYRQALDRLDALVDAAERQLARAEGSDVVETLFPHKIDEARLAVTVARQARRVADPDYVLWVITSERGRAHAVTDVRTLVAACGRSAANSTEAPAADRCRRCEQALDRVVRPDHTTIPAAAGEDDICDVCVDQGFDADGRPCGDCEAGREAAAWEAYWDGLTDEERRAEQDMMTEYTMFHQELARQERGELQVGGF